MLNVTVKSGPALRAMDHHAAQLVQLVHSVFQEAPWSFSWALGTPADKPASRQCTAWGFCNILFGNDSDLALLVANGDSPPEELPLHASICGIGAGLPLTEALLPEFDLAGKACTGDYYLATAAVAPKFRSTLLGDRKAYRHLLERRIEAARTRGCPRIFVRTIDGVDKIQHTLPQYGFCSLGKKTVQQAGLPSCREYFVLDL